MTTATDNDTATALALSAAEAAAEVIPAAAPLTAAGVQRGTEHVTASFAGAARAELTTADGMTYRMAVLVGQDLVQALKESPLGGLDLAAATQPAVDAVAAVLGATARAATVTDLGLAVSDLGGPFTVVPLIGEGIDAAVLISDALLVAPAPVRDAGPAAAPFPAETLLSEPAPSGPASSEPTPVVPRQLGTLDSEVFAGSGTPVAQRGIEMLAGVDMEVTVELGRTRMPVRELLALSPGTVLELDRAADGPADLLVNGRLIARGEVVVIDEDFGLRITEIVENASV